MRFRLKNEVILLNKQISYLLVMISTVLLVGCSNDVSIPSVNNTVTVHELPNQQKVREESIVNDFFKTFLEPHKIDDRLIINFGLQNISGEDMWISYGKKMYEIVITSQENEEIIFSEVWDFKDKKNHQVSKGRYNIIINMLVNIESTKSTIPPEQLQASSVIEY